MSSDDRIRAAIDAMTQEVGSGPDIYRPSRFWADLNKRNRRQIDQVGFASFKRTVNQNYFNWLVTSRHHPHLRQLFRWWITRPRVSVVSARVVDWAGVELAHDRSQPLRRTRARLWYAIFVALLWEFVRARGVRPRLDVLEEPKLGNPILVRHRRRFISQDLANSALELEAIEEASARPLAAGETVIEIGAGYGRLAWMMLALTPGLRYIVVDIPPALAIAQEYLTSLFPDRRTFRFRHFDRYDEVAAELTEAELAFLTPNQLEAIPPQRADLLVSISSFQEMRPDQVANFFGQVSRHTDGIFYMKQWRTWTNELDQVTMRQDDYPIPSSWERVYEREHPIQADFFEAAYRVNGPR